MTLSSSILFYYCTRKKINLEMRKILGCIIVIGFFLPNAVAQNHFLVELENRTPDVKTLVMSYEGAQSIPFLAKDIKGVEHSSLDMVGKNMILCGTTIVPCVWTKLTH